VPKVHPGRREGKTAEARRLRAHPASPLLVLLKRPANFSDRQSVKLAEPLKYNLRSVRA